MKWYALIKNLLKLKWKVKSLDRRVKRLEDSMNGQIVQMTEDLKVSADKLETAVNSFSNKITKETKNVPAT